jgi:hypothetical protein
MLRLLLCFVGASGQPDSAGRTLAASYLQRRGRSGPDGEGEARWLPKGQHDLVTTAEGY